MAYLRLPYVELVVMLLLIKTPKLSGVGVGDVSFSTEMSTPTSVSSSTSAR